jgi:hypothetical protein
MHITDQWCDLLPNPVINVVLSCDTVHQAFNADSNHFPDLFECSFFTLKRI